MKDNASKRVAIILSIDILFYVSGKNDEEKEARILQGQYPTDGRHWKDVSADAIDFVRALLVQNPKRRMSMRQQGLPKRLRCGPHPATPTTTPSH